MSKENALFPEVKDAIAFDALWQQAYEKVRELSGELWTDTGDHDPGITLLQAATWNCSDLSYRMSLPLNDLLTQKGQNTLFPEAFGPDGVLTCNTVTADDYRRALLDLHSSDRVSGDISLDTPDQDFLFSDARLIKEPEKSRYHWWYNADTREYSFSKPEADSPPTQLTLRGNLWISVVPTRYTQSLSPDNREKVERRLNQFFQDHRNLGEAVSRITWLQPVTFIPRMTIKLSENINDINQVVAQIYQVTEAFLRPAVIRYTTEQRRALGDPDDAIFEGPRLQHGWQQTTPSQISSAGYTLNLSPLVPLLLAIPGVASLTTLSVDTGDEHITTVPDDSWCWTIADGYYPLLWGNEPLPLLAGDQSPLTLVAKGGINSPLNSDAMQGYLTQEVLIEMASTVLPAGRFRDQTPYIPVGQRLPECYLLQQPNSVIEAPTRAVHQFLLPADQLLADGTEELALLPTLLAFTRRGDAIRGTRWPYAKTSVQQDIHASYVDELQKIEREDVAIFSGPDNTHPNPVNFARELDFLQYLLGYFGTQRAVMPLTQDRGDFLATQRGYLAQQPALGYNRVNIRIDQVSALQKRIAASIGLDSTCFEDAPELDKLPFYLIEHRQLLPQTPDSTFDSEQTPTAFRVDAPKVTLAYSGTGKVVLGQLIDLIAIEGESKFSVRRLLVIDTREGSFTVSTESSLQLLYSLSELQSAWDTKNLRWQNSDVWLQDMDYRLNYAEEQPTDITQRRLASCAQSPYPSMAHVGDTIVLRPAGLQYSMPMENINRSVSADWQIEATIEALDPIAGTLLIKRKGDTPDFPTADTCFRYQWAFSHSDYATTDRFSFVVSAVFNHSLIEERNIVPDRLASWIRETMMAEFPAHVSLISHWLDADAFNNFGATYQRWQNNGVPLGDDAFAIMQMLTLGHLPVPQLAIGLMRVATDDQSNEVMGTEGSQWNTDVILRDELFYVPQDL